MYPTHLEYLPFLTYSGDHHLFPSLLSRCSFSLPSSFSFSSLSPTLITDSVISPSDPAHFHISLYVAPLTLSTLPFSSRETWDHPAVDSDTTHSSAPLLCLLHTPRCTSYADTGVHSPPTASPLSGATLTPATPPLTPTRTLPPWPHHLHTRI